MNTCKFPNVDKSLGPEMKSTGEPVCRGEAIYFIKDMKNPSTPSGALCRAKSKCRGGQVYGERSMYLSK